MARIRSPIGTTTDMSVCHAVGDAISFLWRRRTHAAGLGVWDGRQVLACSISTFCVGCQNPYFAVTGDDSPQVWAMLRLKLRSESRPHSSFTRYLPFHLAFLLRRVGKRGNSIT